MTGIVRQKMMNTLIPEIDNFLAGIEEGGSCLCRIGERIMLNHRNIEDVIFFDEVKNHNVSTSMNNINNISFLTKVTPNTVGVSIHSQREWGDRSQAAFDDMRDNF